MVKKDNITSIQRVKSNQFQITVPLIFVDEHKIKEGYKYKWVNKENGIFLEYVGRTRRLNKNES